MTRFIAFIRFFDWPTPAMCVCVFAAGMVAGALGLA